jgi:prolyl-tRNA synthetase
VRKLFDIINEDLRKKAWRWIDKHVFRASDLDEAKNLLAKRAGIVEVPWCGNAECGHKLEGEVNARVLGTPIDLKEDVSGNCVICNGEAKTIVRVAVAY